MAAEVAPFEQLNIVLRAVVSAAERGDWDTVITLTQPLEIAVASLDGIREQHTSSPEALSEAQFLQKRALDLCSQRVECLRPLIQAFRTASPDEPPP